MRSPTMPHTINLTAGLTAIEALAPNPWRKAFLLSPIPGSLVSQPALTAAVFAAGVGQAWVVPAGVMQVFGMYCWGSGGSGGAAGLVLGGGGGGGGGFDASGPLTVAPGSTFTVDVDAGGTVSFSRVRNPALVDVVKATSGTSGLLDVNGTGGGGVTGYSPQTGGAGFAATGTAPVGGGGGGGAGSFGGGSAGAGTAGGAGGGAATLLGYGPGGGGGAGNNTSGGGDPGAIAGGGGGGGSVGGTASGTGADGLVVIFYVSPVTLVSVSLSPDSRVVAGAGAINYLSGATYPFLLTDEDVGSAIAEPWYIIGSAAGIAVQIVEYSYEPGSIEPAY